MLYEDKKLSFVGEGKGIFSSDILCKVLDESAGFLGSLKSGSFSSSLHHLRSLIELYAIWNFCFNGQKQFEKMMGRYVKFKDIEIYKRGLEQEAGEKNWGISQDRIDKLKESIQPTLKNTFQKKPKDIKKIKAWTGSASIEDYFKSLETHKKNYDLLCFHTHPYAFRCREFIEDTPRDDWPQFLTRVVHYCFCICSSILESEALEDSSAQNLKSIWEDITPILVPRLKKLYEIQSLEGEVPPS